MRVNQNGDPVEETLMFGYVGDTETHVTEQDRDDAIALLCDHLNVRIVKTNATKHGNTELVLKDDNL